MTTQHYLADHDPVDDLAYARESYGEKPSSGTRDDE